MEFIYMDNTFSCCRAAGTQPQSKFGIKRSEKYISTKSN